MSNFTGHYAISIAVISKFNLIIMNLNIRAAKSEDIPSILQLVQELAEFENEPDAVLASLEDYKKHFAEGLFQSIVAESKGEIVGIAIFYDTFSTWKGKMLYLEDFVVKAVYRQTGVGQKIFSAVIEEAKKRGAKLLKWQVLDWNEGAIQFYKKNMATIEHEWLNGKIVF